MKVGYYRHDHGSGNFGDELGPVIAQAMLGRPVEKSNDMSQPVFSVIGSISQNLAPGSHVWGSGIMIYQLRTDNLHIHAVRGPRTEGFYRGIVPMKETIPWGDPALLLPDFYQPKPLPELAGKTGFVPHWSWWDIYSDQQDELEIFHDIHLINPTDSWESVVDQIVACDRIISSSLHGLIIADAYHRPNLWLREELYAHLPDLKFRDYFESISRDFHYGADIKDAANTPYDSPKYWTQGATALDLQPLRDSFPHHLFTGA